MSKLLSKIKNEFGPSMRKLYDKIHANNAEIEKMYPAPVSVRMPTSIENELH